MIPQSDSLVETADRLRRGTIRPAEYIDRLCDRINVVNPDIRAFVSEPNRRQRLLNVINTRGEKASDSSTPPRLHCIPVGVKDIIHVDGLTTRAGTSLPPQLFADSEATVVQQLYQAGAVVLGKTVTTEFAGHAPGPTRNPHNLDHTPGGSSSGSAAAVAAGVCPLALGTQTGGSVIRPAAFCGVVGFKPSFGRVPTDGIVPRSPSLDQVGLFTQDIAGMDIASSVVCQDWIPNQQFRQPTLGIPDGGFLERASTTALTAFTHQIETLTNVGFKVQRVNAFEDLESVDKWHRNLARAETAMVHETWFDEYPELYEPDTAETIREGVKITDQEISEGRAGRMTVREYVHARMAATGVDLWVSPAAPGPAPEGLDDTGSSDMNRSWTYVGLPTLTVPAGTIDGLPIGIQLVSRFYGDEELLAWGGSIEKVLN